MNRIGRMSALIVAAALGIAGRGHANAASEEASLEFFEKKIRPLLIDNCYNCHSANTKALGGLRVVAEQYPELRATENFQQLQSQLSGTEDLIQITRRVYNDTVQTYNTLIQQFPAVVIANAFHFEPRQFFDAPKEAEATPEVSFPGDGTPAPATTPKA